MQTLEKRNWLNFKAHYFSSRVVAILMRIFSCSVDDFLVLRSVNACLTEAAYCHCRTDSFSRTLPSSRWPSISSRSPRLQRKCALVFNGSRRKRERSNRSKNYAKRCLKTMLYHSPHSPDRGGTKFLLNFR